MHLPRMCPAQLHHILNLPPRLANFARVLSWSVWPPARPPLPPAMCSLCWPGHACSEGAATPEPCQPGTHALLDGQPSCESCPKGSYQNETGATSCATCPAGSHNPTLGGRSSFACTRCAPGSFSAMMGNANDTCTSCAAGRYSEALGEMSCRACEPGATAPRGVLR